MPSTYIDNYYSKSITINYWTGAIAGTFFVIIAGARLKIKRIWIHTAVIVLKGFAFGFPLFLYDCHKKIIAQNSL